MHLTRRHILQTALAMGIIGSRSWATNTAQFEGFTIDSVSDGKLVLPVGFLLPGNQDDAVVRDLLNLAGIGSDTYEAPLNVTLMKRNDEIILFDAGSGMDFVPTAGKLPDALAAVGVTPDQITHVIFTHAHPDHIWGVLDEFDEPAFMNARYFIGRAERDYWLDPDTEKSIDPSQLSFVAGARRRIEALGDLLDLFEDGDEILPNIKAIHTPGHTPGHMSLNIHDQIVIIGDALTNTHLAMQRPLLHAGNDHDPETAAITRIKLLNMLLNNDLSIIGYHLPDGGIGSIRKDGDGFAFASV